MRRGSFRSSLKSPEEQLSAGLLLGNGSLDFDFLVEIKVGFPLSPQKVVNFLQSTATKSGASVRFFVFWDPLKAPVSMTVGHGPLVLGDESSLC